MKAKAAAPATQAKNAKGVKSKGQKFSEGHAYKKHKKQFGNISKEKFAKKADDIMGGNFTESHSSLDGRKIYRKGDTIVIDDPHAPDGGSMFKPERTRTGKKTTAKKWYDNWRKKHP